MSLLFLFVVDYFLLCRSCRIDAFRNWEVYKMKLKDDFGKRFQQKLKRASKIKKEKELKKQKEIFFKEK